MEKEDTRKPWENYHHEEGYLTGLDIIVAVVFLGSKKDLMG